MNKEEDLNAALEVADTAYKAAIEAKYAAWDAYSTVTRLACSNTALKAAWDAYSTADTAKDAARDAYEAARDAYAAAREAGRKKEAIAARDAARNAYHDPRDVYFTADATRDSVGKAYMATLKTGRKKVVTKIDYWPG